MDSPLAVSQLQAIFSDSQWLADCQALGITLSEGQVNQLTRFYEILSAFNEHTNLTRIETPRDFLYRHVLDSLHASRFIPASAKVADIGSGGGFPAFPLAIYRPDITITAIESVGKKAKFIEETAKTLNLPNLQVVCERCETLGQTENFRASFDRVTARAVAPLNVLLELSIPLLKEPEPNKQEKAQLLALKGSKFQEELALAKSALYKLHTHFIETHANPVTELSHSQIAIFEKQRTTPKLYPRSPGTPKKSPL